MKTLLVERWWIFYLLSPPFDNYTNLAGICKQNGAIVCNILYEYLNTLFAKYYISNITIFGHLLPHFFINSNLIKFGTIDRPIL